MCNLFKNQNSYSFNTLAANKSYEILGIEVIKLYTIEGEEEERKIYLNPYHMPDVILNHCTKGTCGYILSLTQLCDGYQYHYFKDAENKVFNRLENLPKNHISIYK